VPSTLTCLRVFIASPGGLAEERKAFREEIQEFNESHGIASGVLFVPVGWEDTLGGVGRPQSLINEDVRQSDYFILALWDRWGSSPDATPGQFSSGSEEEFHIALGCHSSAETPMRQIVVLFKSVDPQQMSDPGPQLQKVLAFRSKIEQDKSVLFHTFDSGALFRKLIRKHLAAWMRRSDAIDPSQTPPANIAGTEDTAVETNEDALEDSTGAASVQKAWKLANAGRLTEAEVEFARSIVTRQRPQPLIEYGRFLRRLGRFDQAMVMFEGALAIAGDHQDLQSTAVAYAHLGNLLRVRGDLVGAEDKYRQSLSINEQLGRLEGRAGNLGALGLLLLTRGDLDGAEHMQREALAISEHLAREAGIAVACTNLGLVMTARGNLDDAEKLHRRALEINERLGRVIGLTTNYGNIGNLAARRGDLDTAEEMYGKALDISKRLGRLEGMAIAYGSLGVVMRARRDLDEAENYLMKSLQINEQLGHLGGMASCYANLGSLALRRRDFQAAERMFRKALELNERLGNLHGMQSIYEELARIYRKNGDANGAKQMIEAAAEAGRRIQESTHTEGGSRA